MRVPLPPWRDWTRNGLLHRRMLVRIEPGALSDEGRSCRLLHWRVDREERCSLAKRWPRATSPAFDPLPLRPGRYASLAGAPCFENSDTALPWRFDTSTFRSGAVVQREHAGPSPRRVSDRNRTASPSRHRIKAVRRVLSPEAGGRYPVAVRGHNEWGAPCSAE